MPFNLLLLPLLGGYYFITTIKWRKFHHQRIERQKLIFNSAIYGVGLLVVAHYLIIWLKYSLNPHVINWLYHWLPIKEEHAAETSLSFVLGVGGAKLMNLVLSNRRAIANAIKWEGTELEKLLYDCVQEKSMIQLSLRNNKFYVGWVHEFSEPKNQYIKLTPALSGYRDDKTKVTNITTSYLDLYSEEMRDGSSHLRESMSIVICAEDIITANKFETEIYSMFNGSIKIHAPDEHN